MSLHNYSFCCPQCNLIWDYRDISEQQTVKCPLCELTFAVGYLKATERIWHTDKEKEVNNA